ncbi:MAG: hypothetical protein GXO16_02390 [Epsilonproteobacteria bacterium]|nr:hypothetical protein [Campylobacterota bacterium]
MNDYELLYQRWRRYRLKKILRRWGVTALGIAALAAASVYYYLQHTPAVSSTAAQPPKHDKSSTKNGTDTPPAQNQNNTTGSKKEPIQRNKWPASAAQSGPVNIITPVFSFEKHLVAPSSPPPAPKPLRLDDKELMKKEKTAEAQTPKTQKPATAAPQEPTEKPSKGRLKISTEQKVDIKELERKFYTNPTVGQALVIAKLYYEKNDFKNSAKWALRANSIDKKNEESWILFAKSLAKSGERKKAVSVLEIYARQSGSQRALDLAQKIKSGVFR